METMANVSTTDDDAYCEVDLVDLLNKAEEPKPLYYDAAPLRREGSQKRRINDFKVIFFVRNF